MNWMRGKWTEETHQQAIKEVYVRIYEAATKASSNAENSGDIQKLLSKQNKQTWCLILCRMRRRSQSLEWLGDRCIW